MLRKLIDMFSKRIALRLHDDDDESVLKSIRT